MPHNPRNFHKTKQKEGTRVKIPNKYSSLQYFHDAPSPGENFEVKKR